MENQNSLKLFKNVLWALMVKELKVKYSTKGYLTYFWIVGEPVIQISFFIIMWYCILGREARMGLPIVLVIITGIPFYLFFSDVVKQSMNSADANQSLLGYKQVSIFSTILGRLVIAISTTLISFFSIYIVLTYLGLYYPIYNFILFFVVLFFLILFTLGLALMSSVVGFYFEEAKVVIGFILRFGYFFSGVIFDISILPKEYRTLLMYNPILQAISLIRSSFLRYNLPNPVSGISLNYFFMTSIISFFLGLMVYFIAREEFNKKALAR